MNRRSDLLSGIPLAAVAFRMIVNGSRPNSSLPASESNPSAPVALESTGANGFSSLLFLVLATAQPTINAALPEGDGNGNMSASEAGDDKASTKLLAGNVAAVSASNSSEEEGKDIPCVAKSKSTWPLQPDPTTTIRSSEIAAPELLAQPNSHARKPLPKLTEANFTANQRTNEAKVVFGKMEISGFATESSIQPGLATAQSTAEPLAKPEPLPGQAEILTGEMGAPGFFADSGGDSKPTFSEPSRNLRLMPDSTMGQAEVALGEIIAPGFVAQAGTNSRDIALPSTSNPGRSGTKPVQPIHVGAAADERKEAGRVVDRSDQQLIQLPDDLSLSNFEKAGIAFNQKEKSARGVPAAARGDETGSLKGVGEKILEHSEPWPATSFLRGHVSKLPERPNYGEFSISAPDGLDSEPMLGSEFHFDMPSTADTAEAESSAFTADPKEHEFPEPSRNPTQLPTDTPSLTVKVTLPHEGASPAPDISTSTWRPTVEHITGEIVGHIQMNRREAILHLDPPELGKIKIDLHLKGDKLQAHIFTEGHEARSLIENHIQELRQALQANSLDLVDVRVHGGWHGATGDAMHGFSQQQQQQPASQQGWDLSSGNTVDGDAVESQPNYGSTSEEGRVSMWA